MFKELDTPRLNLKTFRAMRLSLFLSLAMAAAAVVPHSDAAATQEPKRGLWALLPIEVCARIFSFLPAGMREEMLLELRHVHVRRGTVLALLYGDPALVYARLGTRFKKMDMRPLLHGLGPRSMAAIAAGAVLNADVEDGPAWFGVGHDAPALVLASGPREVVLDERMRGVLLRLCVSALRNRTSIGLRDLVHGRPSAVRLALLVDSVAEDSGIAAQLWPLCAPPAEAAAEALCALPMNETLHGLLASLGAGPFAAEYGRAVVARGRPELAAHMDLANGRPPSGSALGDADYLSVLHGVCLLYLSDGSLARYVEAVVRCRGGTLPPEEAAAFIARLGRARLPAAVGALLACRHAAGRAVLAEPRLGDLVGAPLLLEGVLRASAAPGAQSVLAAVVARGAAQLLHVARRAHVHRDYALVRRAVAAHLSAALGQLFVAGFLVRTALLSASRRLL